MKRNYTISPFNSTPFNRHLPNFELERRQLRQKTTVHVPKGWRVFT